MTASQWQNGMSIVETFDLDFAQTLAELASDVSRVAPGGYEHHQVRAVLYLSLLSSEISMKSALASAGFSTSNIRRHSHNLAKLLATLGDCEVREGGGMWVRATSLRGVVVDPDYADATVGHLLESERNGSSKYPSEIRYGDILEHYPLHVMAGLAAVVCNWVRDHESSIRRRLTP